MVSVALSETIKVSPERVFALLSDFERAPQYSSYWKSVKLIGQETGSRIYETVVQVEGRKFTSVTRITSQPNERIDAETVDGDGKGTKLTFKLTKIPEGTQLKLEGDIVLPGFAKILRGLVKGRIESVMKEQLAIIRKITEKRVDNAIADALEDAGINFVCSMPCSLLSGIIDIISKKENLIHLPATREEEGVGICAGAYLGGARPALLMQNSGLGNSINALLSLINPCEIDLLLLMSNTGRGMETATTALLSVIGAKYAIIERERDLDVIKTVAERTDEGVRAVLLTPKVWKEA